MSILQVDMNKPGGTQRQLPSDETTTLVGNVLSMSSSALRARGHVIRRLHDSDTHTHTQQQKTTELHYVIDGRTDGRTNASLAGPWDCFRSVRHGARACGSMSEITKNENEKEKASKCGERPPNIRELSARLPARNSRRIHDDDSRSPQVWISFTFIVCWRWGTFVTREISLTVSCRRCSNDATYVRSLACLPMASAHRPRLQFNGFAISQISKITPRHYISPRDLPLRITYAYVEVRFVGTDHDMTISVVTRRPRIARLLVCNRSRR